MAAIQAEHRDRVQSLFGDVVPCHGGSMFDAQRAIGRSVALAMVEWLQPCIPGQIVDLWMGSCCGEP